jgi:aldose 1-epimerase
MGGLNAALTLGAPGKVTARILPYGATVASLRVPDRQAQCDEVVLRVPDYTVLHPYFGATVGRYANRIARGRFSLNGTAHQLATNNGAHALHGGVHGFSRRLWTVVDHSPRSAVLSYRSEDGEEGFPGDLDVEAIYTIGDHELRIDYKARADRDTVINLTNHTYFNLNGGDTILDHILRIDADHYTPIDETLIPTGEISSVAGTPFDFRAPARIGALLNEAHPQLKFGRGYDHNWVLNKAGSAELRTAAELHELSRGRTLTILTTEPGLQFYAGCQLDGSFGYPRFGGLALETQHFPDSPNHPGFPSTVLRGDETYESSTIWRFGTL